MDNVVLRQSPSDFLMTMPIGNPMTHVRKGGWLNGPAFLPRATSADEVFTNHRTHCPQPISSSLTKLFSFYLVILYPPLHANTLQQALTPLPVWVAGQVALRSYLRLRGN